MDFQDRSSNALRDTFEGFGNRMLEDGGELEKRVEKGTVEGH